MKVLYLEDRGDVARWSVKQPGSGIDFFWAQDFIEADELLEKEGPFDAAIVDLGMDKKDLPPQLRKESGNQLGGWVYYDKILRMIPPLDKNTIFLSALLEEFTGSIPEDKIGELVLVDKGDADAMSKVLTALRQFDSKGKDKLKTGEAPHE